MKQMSNPSLVEEMDIFKTNGDDDDDDRLRSSNKLSFPRFSFQLQFIPTMIVFQVA